MSQDSSTPSAAASPPPPTPSVPIPPPKSDKGDGHGKIRGFVEGLAGAVLAAVLLKPFLLEAYVIPTPSMQPTMMGSDTAGVNDRLIVDKSYYELHEPERFDIVVFRYPIRQNQNYVKRIVGVGGDRLRIAGGNVYQVEGDGATAEQLTAIAKPDAVQDVLWREVYPQRREMLTGAKILGRFFRGSVWDWSEDGTALVARQKGSGDAYLSFTDTENKGLTNVYTDGYAPDIAADMAAGGDRTDPSLLTGVQDARFAFTITPEATVDRLEVRLGMKPVATATRNFDLVVDGGKGRLVASEEGGDTRVESEPFDFPLAAGTATRIAFAHVDDRMVAWHDGRQVASLDVGALKCVRAIDAGGVTLRMRVGGERGFRLDDLRIDRDTHYTDGGREAGHVIEVPAGHFFMMGDNTLGSEDSRQWQGVTLAVDDAGNLVDPARNPQARKLYGNRRPGSIDEPINDENPVLVHGRKAIVFMDRAGEYHVLRAEGAQGQLNPRYSRGTMVFGSGKDEWQPESRHDSFVPREHVLGRPILVFWPWYRMGTLR